MLLINQIIIHILFVITIFNLNPLTLHNFSIKNQMVFAQFAYAAFNFFGTILTLTLLYALAPTYLSISIKACKTYFFNQTFPT